jgi:hypothetical protein
VLCALLGAAVGGAAMQLALRPAGLGASQSTQASSGRDPAPRFGEMREPFEPEGPPETMVGEAPGSSALPGAGDPMHRAGADRVSAADAAVRLAARDPGTAMNRAFAIESHWLRLDTIERVAAVWAEREPNETLAFLQAARELDPGVRSAVRARALEVWAGDDAGRALDYLLGRNGQDLFFFDEAAGRRFARELAARQPYELLYAANGLPKGIVRAELRGYAIANLVERDLAFALREAALAPPGPDRRQWVTAIERVYPGRTNQSR